MLKLLTNNFILKFFVSILFFLFAFVSNAKANVVRDCSYFEVEGYNSSGEIVSYPRQVKSNNNNTAVIYTSLGSYIRTRVKSYWPPSLLSSLSPPRGILYEDGNYARAYPRPTFIPYADFVLGGTVLTQYRNNLQ
ncbi:MAG: hypothetical protein N2558_04370, partial [Patescibacteria group bacterium]|nr:hypothetical protein [Patescibacteria group bacterium]